MRTKSEEGFTVIEFFVSIFLTLVMMGIVYSVYRLQTRSLGVQEKRLDAQQYVRSILSLMVREVRNVGHFPMGLAACTTTPAHTLGIVEASKQVFHFVYDSNENTDCADQDEDIRYSFNISNCPIGYGNIMRKERNSLAIALTDCNVPTTDGDFSFAYYRKDDLSAIDYLVLSAELGNIQRMRITATVESKNPDSEFGGAKKAVMKSNVNLRNRGLLP